MATVKLSGSSSVNAVASPLPKVGVTAAGSSTVSRNVWLTGVPLALMASMVSVLVVLLAVVPTTPCGVPPMVAVPLPLSVKARSDGNAPISLMPATVPVVGIVIDSASSTVNVAALALIVGVTGVDAPLSVRMKT